MNLNRTLLRETGIARHDLAATILASGFTGLLIVLQAYSISFIVDGVFRQGWGLEAASPWLAGFVGLSLLRAFFIWLKENSAQSVASKVKLQLRKRSLEWIAEMGPNYAGAQSSGALANTITQGIETLDAYYRRFVPQLIIAVMVPMTILLFVFPLDLLTGLILLLTAPLIPFFMVLIGDRTEKLTQKQWTSLSRLSAAFQDTLQGLKTLKALGRSEERASDIHDSSEAYRQATMGVLRVGFLSALVLEWIATLSSAIVAVEIGLRLLTGRIDFQSGLFILFLAPEFYFPLRLLSSYFHAGRSGTAAASSIYRMREQKPVIEPGTSPWTAHAAPRIQFQGVSYQYPERDGSVSDGSSPTTADAESGLQELDFELAAGTTTALVGPSGGGKTTISSLLLRFIDPSQGLIKVNGQPLSVLDLRSWRSQIAWVPQKPTLFYGSILDNIRLADPTASVEAVRHAAGMSMAHVFIEKLPDGYATLIGERGHRLSGGQQVRLALARAFLKDAPLLILDEISADLDPDTEARLMQQVWNYCQTRTTLLIAHRLATITEVDQILVIAGGRMIEQGTHNQLLRRGGTYAELIASYRNSVAEVAGAGA